MNENGQTDISSIVSTVKLRQITVHLGKSAGLDDMGHRLGLTTGAQISVCKVCYGRVGEVRLPDCAWGRPPGAH